MDGSANAFTTQAALRPRRSTGVMAAYAAISAPLALLYLPLQVLIPAYYAQDLGLGFAAVGLALMICRVFDMFTDPVIGWLSETTRPPGGYRRPWLLIGVPGILLSVWMLFAPPADAGVVYLIFWSSMLYLAGTAAIIPFNAWGADLAVDYEDRNRATAWRTGFGIGGALLGLGVIAVATVHYGEDGGPILAALAIVGGGLAAAALPLLFYAPDDRATHAAGRPKLLRGFCDAIAAPGYPRLIGAFFVNAIGNQIPAVLFIVYVGAVLEQPLAAGAMLFLYFAFGVAAIPFWVRMAQGRLKQHVWIASIALACAGFVVVPFLGPGDIVWFGLVCAVTGIAFGADMVLPASMNADQAEIYERDAAVAQTGVFFAVWGTATKLAAAIGVGVAFPIIGFAQPAGAIVGAVDPTLVAFVYGWTPILFKAAAALVIWRYPLDDRATTTPATL